MPTEKTSSPVFKQTYRRYLEELKQSDLNALAPVLDIAVENNTAIIPFFGKPYRVSVGEGVLDPAGKRPDFSVCVVLLKYLLLCPSEVSEEKDWISFKDFRDAAPLINYFSQNVQEAIVREFSGRGNDLAHAAENAGGRQPAENYPYDVAVTLTPLPRLSVLLLFNDADEEFPAQCSLLFQKRANRFLDPECLAIAGWLTAEELKTK